MCTSKYLLEEVGNGECCRTESGKVTHVITDAHPLEPLLLSFVPRSMTFSL